MTTFKKIVIARIEELEILLKKNGGKTKTAQWIRELLEINHQVLRSILYEERKSNHHLQ